MSGYRIEPADDKVRVPGEHPCPVFPTVRPVTEAYVDGKPATNVAAKTVPTTASDPREVNMGGAPFTGGDRRLYLLLALQSAWLAVVLPSVPWSYGAHCLS